MHLTPIAEAVFDNVFLAVCTALALVGGLLILFGNRAVADPEGPTLGESA